MNQPQDFAAMYPGQTHFQAPAMAQHAPNITQHQPDFVNGVAPSPVPRPAPEMNAATLCRIGQETVHDFTARLSDFFSTLKSLQPPNGSITGSAAANDKKGKVLDQLRTLSVALRRLRIIYDKCCDLTKNLDMSYTHVENLIPLKEEWDQKSEEKKNTESYRQAIAERDALREQVASVNLQLKEVIDLQRRTVWEINTMLAMRQS